MKEKENCPYGRCGCCRKCQPPCRQQQEIADKAYNLARDVRTSVNGIVEALSCVKDGETTNCEDIKWYSFNLSMSIGALIRIQNLIGDLQKGGAR